MQFDGKVEFVLSGYLEHRFDRRFDAACLMGFFDYIENPLEIFEKLKREVRKEIYASFPKSGGPLAWQRRVRYKLRKCPLWLYSRSDVLGIMERAGFVNNFHILDFGRDWFVKIDLRGARH